MPIFVQNKFFQSSLDAQFFAQIFRFFDISWPSEDNRESFCKICEFSKNLEIL